MDRSELNGKVLISASRNAQRAIDAVSSTEFDNALAEEKVAWAMIAMIHCDICRLVVAFDERARDGLARLLWMADIVSRLHEAQRWYSEKGSPLFQKI